VTACGGGVGDVQKVLVVCGRCCQRAEVKGWRTKVVAAVCLCAQRREEDAWRVGGASMVGTFCTDVCCTVEGWTRCGAAGLELEDGAQLLVYWRR